MASATPLGNDKYKIFVELGYDDKGKRKRKTKTVTAKSPRALKRAITEFEIEVANSDVDDVEKILFSTFVERWMNIYVRPDLAVKTRDTYNTCLRNGVMDEFGDMKMSKIKTFHLVKFFKEQKETGKKTLTGKYLMLSGIFSKAVEWEVISENPMKKVSPPEPSKRYVEAKFYDEEQLKHLLKVLDKVYKKHRIEIKLAALVGLRMAEIAGIRIESINKNDNTIYIDKTLQRDKETKTFFLGPTKNKRPRTVQVPAAFMKELADYAKEQKEKKMKYGPLWNPLLDKDGEPINLLFTNEFGYPNHINSMSNEWRKIIKRHNLPPISFHGLRHSCASYMVSRNVNFKIIQEQLGHADIRETLNTYSHLTQKDKSRAADLFNEIL